MPEKYELIQKIQNLKKQLELLISQKDDLLDSEIIDVSEKLDRLLNEYEKLMMEKKN